MKPKPHIEAPSTLKDYPFYGLNLDEEQKNFRDAVWDPETIITFCNARAGTGKTTIAVGDDCKIIVIGHTGQIDLFKHPENSGFAVMLQHFQEQKDPRAKVCELHHNYRGWVSNTADEVLSEIERKIR